MNKLVKFAVAVLASKMARLARPEDQSLLAEADVNPTYQDVNWSGNQNSVISAGFKSFVHFGSADPKGDGSND